MKKSLRYGALALGLAAGAALIASPGAARSFHEDSDFGGTWSPIGPSDQGRVRSYYRYSGPDYYAYYGPPVYYGPRYSYYDDYAPDYYGPRDGVGFSFSLD